MYGLKLGRLAALLLGLALAGPPVTGHINAPPKDATSGAPAKLFFLQPFAKALPGDGFHIVQAG
jgi:hypothetical protein